jgi:endonuclease III
MTRTERAVVINKKLAEVYPTPKPPLNYSNVHELLFAVIMSAQATDARVNIITPALFKRFPTIKDYAEADVNEIKKYIGSINFFNNKAKNIKAAAQKIMTEFNGQVPNTMEELVTLPGVARKTANVVLSQGFNINVGIAVDTHVIRVAGRLGLTKNIDPIKIERDLMPMFPQTEWRSASLRIIFHGREICHARNPKCGECALNEVCPSAFRIR